MPNQGQDLPLHGNSESQTTFNFSTSCHGNKYEAQEACCFHLKALGYVRWQQTKSQTGCIVLPIPNFKDFPHTFFRRAFLALRTRNLQIKNNCWILCTRQTSMLLCARTESRHLHCILVHSLSLFLPIGPLPWVSWWFPLNFHTACDLCFQDEFTKRKRKKQNTQYPEILE